MRDSLLPMFRLFMFQCFLTMLVALPFSAEAQDYDHHNSPGHRHDSGHRDSAIDPIAQINRQMYDHESLDLTRELNLTSSIRNGQTVESVKVQLRARQQSVLTLELNGRVLQEVSLRNGAQSQVLSLKGAHLHEYDQLTLVSHGSIYVQTVSAQLQRRGHGGGNGGSNQQILRAQIEKQVRGQELLPLQQLVQAQSRIQLQGLQLQRVVVEANSTSYWGMAQAQLIINGIAVGFPQTLPNGREETMLFELPRNGMNVIGQDLRRIQLLVTGDARIKMVGFEVEQRGIGHGGGYNQSVQVNVNRAFYGTQRVGLKDLLGYAPRVNMNAPVEALTIVARGHGNIMVTGGGSALGAVTVSGRFGTTETLRIGNYSTANDIKLRVTGNITIESIRVKMGR